LNNCALSSVYLDMNNAARISSPRLVAHPKRHAAGPKLAPGVVAQVRLAFRPRARLATLLGCLLGGFVPLASFVVAHREANFADLHGWIADFLVLGGLVFSAKTVREWGVLAFNDGRKALGFVVLIEGVSTLSQTPWLAITALSYLIGINAVATGCTLSLNRK
jgi:hypothetical protein